MEDLNKNKDSIVRTLRANEQESLDTELDLVAELELLAATESDQILELEKQQADAADRIQECLIRLGRWEPTERLASVCQQVLRERAILMDVDYLSARGRELLARDSILAPEVSWANGFPVDRGWASDRISEALDDILQEDEELYADGGSILEGSDFHHHCLVYCYGIDPQHALAASVRFHRLGEQVRESFFALIVEQNSVERCVAAGLGPRFRLKEHVQSALNALLFLEDLWPSRETPRTKKQEDHLG